MDWVLTQVRLALRPGADRVNVRFSNVLDETQESKFKQEFAKLDATASYEVNTVDPEMAKELGTQRDLCGTHCEYRDHDLCGDPV